MCIEKKLSPLLAHSPRHRAPSSFRSVHRPPSGVRARSSYGQSFAAAFHLRAAPYCGRLSLSASWGAFAPRRSLAKPHDHLAALAMSCACSPRHSPTTLRDLLSDLASGRTCSRPLSFRSSNMPASWGGHARSPFEQSHKRDPLFRGSLARGHDAPFEARASLRVFLFELTRSLFRRSPFSSNGCASFETALASSRSHGFLSKPALSHMNPCASVRSESLARPKSFEPAQASNRRELLSKPAPIRAHFEVSFRRPSLSSRTSRRSLSRLRIDGSVFSTLAPTRTSPEAPAEALCPFGHHAPSRNQPPRRGESEHESLSGLTRSPFEARACSSSLIRGCSAFEPDANHFRGPHRERSFPFRETAPHESVSKLELLRSLARPILLESSLLPVLHRSLARPIQPEAH